MRKRDRDISSAVSHSHAWLATICQNPHMRSSFFLQAAAAAHLLHACGIRPPKHACSNSPAHKRHKVQHHQQQPRNGLHVKAACAGDVGKLEQLCHNGGVDGNTVCDHPHPGSTILAAAAASGTAEGVRALLGLGADTYVADESGNSPLMMAAAGGYHTVVKVLLEAGADPWHVNYGGVNSLFCAARAGSAACIQLLLKEGVDADYCNSELGGGETALLLASEAGCVAAVKLLLTAGARVNRVDKEGRTPLWFAARQGHALVVQLLLSQPGVKHIRSFGERGTTPLDEAHAAHHSSCVALLSAHLQRHEQHGGVHANKQQQLQHSQRHKRTLLVH